MPQGNSLSAPPRRQRLDPAVRRAGILAEAEALIARHGYRGVSVEQVATACGMTKAGLLHHFASKPELLTAVLERRDDEDLAFLRARFPGPLDRTDLRQALAGLVQRNVERPELIRLYTTLSAEALDVGHPANRYFEERLRSSRRVLEQAAASWHPEPAAFAVRVLAIMDGLQLNWLRDPSIDLRVEWDQCAAWLFRDVPA